MELRNVGFVGGEGGKLEYHGAKLKASEKINK